MALDSPIQVGQLLAERFRLSQQLLSSDDCQRWLAEDQTAGDLARLTLVGNQAADSITVASTSNDGLVSRLRAITALQHPALIRDVGLIDVGLDEQVSEQQLIVEFGVDLADQAPFVPTSVEQLFKAAIRCAEALAHAHQRGVPHGNVGSAAVRNTQTGGIQLGDFSPHDQTNHHADQLGFAKLLKHWAADQIEALPMTALNGLTARLQSTDSLSMAAVRDSLEDIWLRWQRGIDSDQLSSALAQDAAAPVTAAPASSNWPVIAVASGVAVLAVLAVLLYLPSAPQAPQPVAKIVATEPELPTEEPPRPPTPEELEQLLRDRSQAEAVLDELINLQLDLREKAVEVWGAEQIATVAELVASGESAFRGQQFKQALADYTQGRDVLLVLQEQMPLVLQAHLDAGEQALLDWRAVDASEQFAAALAIDADNVQAQLGQQRSSTLDQARLLFKQARLDYRNGELEQAKLGYQQLQALDPLVDGPAAALAEINTTLADEAFRSIISEAMSALDSGHWAAARAGFTEAARQRPNEQVIADGLLELDRRQRETDLQQLRGAAEQAMVAQDWPRAVEQFDLILSKDANIAFAQRGRALAVERAGLDRRLAQYLAKPAAWLTKKGRMELAATLSAVESASDPGSKILDKASRLANDLALSQQPVLVEFESDNSCDVMVFRVARLGQFASHRLNLLPGNYVAVGARSGYRDVRQEFMVPPGRSPDTVRLLCNEPV